MTAIINDDTLSYAAQVRRIAQARSDHPAIIFVHGDDREEILSYGEWSSAADRLAARLIALGANVDSVVAITMPNSIEFYVALLATWRIGACPAMLKHDFTPWERERYLDVASPDVLIGDWTEAVCPRIASEIVRSDSMAQGSVDPVPDKLPKRAWAIASGGSTGRPKLIVNCRPASLGWQFARLGGDQAHGDDVQLICTPLYHTSALSLSVKSLLAGDTMIVLRVFDAARVVSLIERYKVSLIGLVAATLIRILRLPDLRPEHLASLRMVVAGGGAITQEVLRGWDALIGADKLLIGYGASEGIGTTSINGAELLVRPGTVGQATNVDIQIVDEQGQLVPQGGIGEVYLRAHSGDSDCFEYWGGDIKRVLKGGFVSVGDLGWLDPEDYLYIADRRTDMIKTGGVNVFPAEVEVALLENPAITDAVVIGLPDPDWGRRLHAIVVATDPAHIPSHEDMTAFAKARLAPQKVPKAFEFVSCLGRTETMKLNRNALAEARSGGSA